MRTLQYLLGALFTPGAQPAALAADSTIAISGYVRDNAPRGSRLTEGFYCRFTG